MLPIVAALAKAGLPILVNAITAVGKDAIEKKLGIDIEDATRTEAGLIRLRELEFQHEEWLVDASLRQMEMENKADATAQQSVTERWKFDMSSDSWLSKNVRPIILLYWTAAITGLIILDSAVREFTVKNAWVELIETSYLLVLGAYFVGRTAQHITNMRSKK